jgi:hypothetical protein
LDSGTYEPNHRHKITTPTAISTKNPMIATTALFSLAVVFSLAKSMGA